MNDGVYVPIVGELVHLRNYHGDEYGAMGWEDSSHLALVVSILTSAPTLYGVLHENEFKRRRLFELVPPGNESKDIHGILS
jgi:hypothetical protein